MWSLANSKALSHVVWLIEGQNFHLYKFALLFIKNSLKPFDIGSGVLPLLKF